MDDPGPASVPPAAPRPAPAGAWRRRLAAALLAALAAVALYRLCYPFFVHPMDCRASDSLRHWGDGLTIFRPTFLNSFDSPLYQIWIWALRALSGDDRGLVALGTGLLCAAMVPAWYKACRELFGRATARLLAVLVCAMPSCLAIYGCFMRETLALPLLGLALWLHFRAWRKGSLAAFALSLVAWLLNMAAGFQNLPLAALAIWALWIRIPRKAEAAMIVFTLGACVILPIGLLGYWNLKLFFPFGGYPEYVMMARKSGSIGVSHTTSRFGTYCWSSPSFYANQLAPFGTYKTWRKAKFYSFHLDQGEKGRQLLRQRLAGLEPDWRAHRWDDFKENAVFFLCGPSWPDSEGSRHWSMQANYTYRWSWLLMAAAVLLLGPLARGDERRIFLLWGLWIMIALMLVQDRAVMEGRYRKCLEPLAVLAMGLLAAGLRDAFRRKEGRGRMPAFAWREYVVRPFGLLAAVARRAYGMDGVARKEPAAPVQPRHPYRPGRLLAWLALYIPLGAALAVFHPSFAFPDGLEAVHLSRAMDPSLVSPILQGYTPADALEPGAPRLFLAPFSVLFQATGYPVLAARLLVFACGVLALVLFHRTLSRRVPPGIALATTVLLSLCPPFVAASHQAAPAGLLLPWTALCLFLAAGGDTPLSPGRHLLLGLVSAAGLWIHPAGLLLVPASLLLVLLRDAGPGLAARLLAFASGACTFGVTFWFHGFLPAIDTFKTSGLFPMLGLPVSAATPPAPALLADGLPIASALLLPPAFLLAGVGLGRLAAGGRTAVLAALLLPAAVAYLACDAARIGFHWRHAEENRITTTALSRWAERMAQAGKPLSVMAGEEFWPAMPGLRFRTFHPLLGPKGLDRSFRDCDPDLVILHPRPLGLLDRCRMDRKRKDKPPLVALRLLLDSGYRPVLEGRLSWDGRAATLYVKQDLLETVALVEGHDPDRW